MQKIQLKEKMRNGKTTLAIGLLVTTAGFLVPHSSKSNPPAGCTKGSNGDCVSLTDGNAGCSWGAFWNDCN
ncbi:hypothetical protein [Puia sp.]|jgi:hypothetical protein|uniref:hypothetical protein n=1 Tax=Puia sp. TaxID=2045100 RepID=UPI002F40495D